MGTWAAGPFKSDAALDYVGEIVAQLEETIRDCVSAFQIDENFDQAFAALAMLSLLALETGASAPPPGDVEAWRDAMLAGFDEQIDGMNPSGSFKEEQRAALNQELKRLLEISKDFHAP